MEVVGSFYSFPLYAPKWLSTTDGHEGKYRRVPGMQSNVHRDYVRENLADSDNPTANDAFSAGPAISFYAMTRAPETLSAYAHAYSGAAATLAYDAGTQTLCSKT